MPFCSGTLNEGLLGSLTEGLTEWAGREMYPLNGLLVLLGILWK